MAEQSSTERLKERSFEEFLDQKPDLAELTEHIITNEWYMIGIQLKCNDTKLDELEEKNKPNEYKTSKMFQLWLNSPTASRRQVLEVLKAKCVNQNRIALSYEQHLKELHDSTYTPPSVVAHRDLQNLCQSLRKVIVSPLQPPRQPDGSGRSLDEYTTVAVPSSCKPEEVIIGGHIYSLFEIPGPDTPLVLRERDRLLGAMDLEALIDDLKRLGTCAAIVYYGVVGFDSLQTEVQGFVSDVTKLCEKSTTVIENFSATVLSSLKTAYKLLLLDSIEDQALDIYADVTSTAQVLAIAAEELQRDFEHQAEKTIFVLDEIQYREDDKIRELHQSRFHKEMELKKATVVKQMSLYRENIRKMETEEKQVNAAIDALQNAIRALKSLAAVMLQAAIFWKQLQEHCNLLAKDETKKLIETATMKFSEEKRLKFWTASGFKTRAVQFYAQWVALDTVSGIYMERIKLTQRELYTYIQEALCPNEARKKVKELAGKLLQDLESEQKMIAERKEARK